MANTLRIFYYNASNKGLHATRRTCIIFGLLSKQDAFGLPFEDPFTNSRNQLSQPDLLILIYSAKIINMHVIHI